MANVPQYYKSRHSPSQPRVQLDPERFMLLPPEVQAYAINKNLFSLTE